jgi:hypothetical protein
MGNKISTTGFTEVAVQTSQLHPRKYIAVYNNDWYTRRIIAQNDEYDILVKFME